MTSNGHINKVSIEARLNTTPTVEFFLRSYPTVGKNTTTEVVWDCTEKTFDSLYRALCFCRQAGLTVVHVLGVPVAPQWDNDGILLSISQ